MRSTTTIAHEQQAGLISILVQRLEDLAYRKTQREIAEKAGFQNANAISLLKTGKMKLPLDRVEAMAKALEIDTRTLLVPALRQYYTDEVVEMIAAVFSDAQTDTESEVLQLVRRHLDTGKPLANHHRQALVAVFKGVQLTSA